MSESHGFDRPRFLRVFAIFVYLFLFVPILVVILFSFNSIKSLNVFDGFSLQWYERVPQRLDPCASRSSPRSRSPSLTMLAATVIGTALAIGLVRSHGPLGARAPTS